MGQIAVRLIADRRLRDGIFPAAVAMLLVILCMLPASAEVIREFDVDVRLRRDCSLDIKERIVMDFEAAHRHGIYRVIPVGYSRYGASYTTELRLKSITDQHGNPYRYETDRQGNDINIKIGDPHATITGTHVYVVRYSLRRAVNFFGDKPEVYWNATGNEWPFRIDRATVNFYPPEGVPPGDIGTACYVGVLGSHEKGKVAAEAGHIVYSASGLEPGEGLTIVASLPKGAVEPASFWQELLWWLRDWWPLVVIPGATGAFLLSEWQRSGRDEEGRQAVAVEWGPPRDLTPAEVGTLVDEECHTRDVVATLIDLAARGYLKIRQLPAEGFLFFSNKDYEFVKLYDNDGALRELQPHEQSFLRALFSGFDSVVKLSDLKYKFYKEMPQIREEIYHSLTDRKYFKQNPETVRSMYYMAAGLFAVIAVILVFIKIPTSVPWILGFLLSAVIVGLVARAMPARTAQGSKALRECLGFERFVRMAEKERIRVLAKDDPTVFGRLLPYAMVLGVADQWADAFEDLIKAPPSWYEPYGVYEPGYVFRPRAFVNSLGSCMHTAGDTFVSQPSSSSSGAGGGFSGMSGGFSGGGFGGGGGGSW